MTSKKRRRHTPDQIIGKLARGQQTPRVGQGFDKVYRHLAVAASHGAH